MRVVAVLGAAVLLGLLGFVGWQEGVPLYQRSQPVPPVTDSEVLALPAQVYDPPPYVPSTQDTGPPGPVGLVFRGRLARHGFTGEVPNPWYVVSARTGDYRRLDARHLSQVRTGPVLNPQGTQVAWAWPGGIDRYDTMTGGGRTYRVDRADSTGPLVWSPDSRHIAFGRDPVRVLDVGTGEVTALPLRTEQATTPAWTPDGQWVTVTSGGTVEAATAASGRRTTLAVTPGGTPVGDLRDAEWSDAGELAGVHRQPRFGRNVLRVLRMPRVGAAGVRAGERVEVVDASPEQVSIQGFLGWGRGQDAVLTGLRAETGPIEQALVLSLGSRTVSSYMQFPTLGDNWTGASTVSVATDLLRAPSEDLEQPTQPWSPGAKLLLCLLLALFPTTYYLIARRPRGQ